MNKTKTKKKARIFRHKPDSDGVASYVIAHKALEGDYDITEVPYNYGDEEPDLETILQNDLVVILDVCLAPATMKALYLETRRRKDFDCIWVDHHKSSIEQSIPGGWSLMHGYRMTGRRAACALAWDYFHGMNTRVPAAVTLLSAYDVHETDNLFFDWETEIVAFQYGFREKFDLDSAALLKDYDALFGPDANVLGLIRDGYRIYRYEKKTGSKAVECWGYPVTVAGKHAGLCCLTNRFGSLHFEERMKREGQEIAVCVNRSEANKYKVSMYAPGDCTLDIGKYLADTYGGGGHPGAGGCTLDFAQFKLLMTAGII